MYKKEFRLVFIRFLSTHITLILIKHTCKKRAHLPELLLPSSQEKLQYSLQKTIHNILDDHINW